MHLFYNASQIIKMVVLIGRLICHIISIFTVNFGIKGWQMAWLSKVYRFFSGTQSICCSSASVRKKQPNTVMQSTASHTKVLRKNTSCLAPENFDDDLR